MSSAPAAGHGDSHGAEAHAETPHTTRAKDPKIVNESQSIIGKIQLIFWWIAGIIVLLLVMKSCKGDKKEDKTSSGTPAAVAPAFIPEKHTRIITDKMFVIPRECLRVYLRQGWRTYPFLGAVEIRNEEGRLLGIDKPGEELNLGYQPDGMYTFCASPSGEERKIQIFSDWRPVTQP